MLKSAAFLVVPGAMGGLGLLYDPGSFPGGQPVWEKAHLVEVGVVFDEEAVRAALPPSLEPSQGFTGGIGIYSSPGDQDNALPDGGYVWIDVDYQTGTRYIVRSLSEAGAHPDIATDPDKLVAHLAAEETSDGLLRADIMAGSEGGLDLIVQPILNTCQTGLEALSQRTFASGLKGRLQTAPNQIVETWCDADVVSADVTALPHDVLSTLEPKQILWAGVAVPLGPSPLDTHSE